MADLNALVDQLSELTVLEAAELSKLLEEKWGVSAAAAVAAAPAAGGGGAAAPAEEAKPAPSAWIYRRAQLSKPVFVGPGEWRRSGFDKGTRTKANW